MKYDLNTLVIFCESQWEKEKAIDFFYEKWGKKYHSSIDIASNWKTYPYVYYNDYHKFVSGNTGNLSGRDKNLLNIIPLKKIYKNFKRSIPKFYVSKWKKIDWTQ